MERISANFCYRLLYAEIFSVAILFCFSGLIGISDIGWKHIAVLLISSAALCAVCLLNGRQRIYSAVLGIFVFLFLFWSIGSERCLAFFGRVLDIPVIINLSLNRYELSAGELIYIEFGRVFLLAFVCYLIQLLLEKNIYLKIISADAVGGWMLYMQKMPEAGVVFFVLYTGLILTEWIRHQWRKMKNENVQAYVLSILPFLIAYAVLLSFMPMQDKPYDWQWAKNIYRNAEEKIIMYTENLGNISNEYFEGTTSGFSGEGGFFSKIMQDNRQLMTLGIGREKDMSVYLAGKVFDSFDGREWKNGGENSGDNSNGGGGDLPDSEKVLDVMETIYALEDYADYAGSDARNYYKNISMDVSYLYFHTNYLLAPSKTWKIEDRDKSVRYHLEDNDIAFDKKAGYGTRYALRFCRLNMDREEMYRFMESYTGGDMKAWTDITLQYTGRRIPIEELHAYRDTMEERYLPATNISPEAEEWLSFVTEDAESDVEKLKYIESALSSMAYSTSPGQLPEKVTDEESFLDYFLLEKREGYCAHYATAFVLLARAEGFPARYVQGFCVPVVSGDETLVYSDMAHAWPEVYIRGKGWIPFEPTPGFGANRYTVWEESKNRDEGSSYTGKLQFQAHEDALTSGGEMSDESMRESRKSNRFLPYVTWVILILSIGSVFAFIVDWLLEKHREKKRKPDEKYRPAVLHNLQILDMLGYKREPSETYHELAERIRRENSGTGGKTEADQDVEEDSEIGENEITCNFIETYEKHLYGMLEISEQILTEVLAERKQLFTQLKKRRRKTYLLCRIKLYIVRHR